MIVTYLICWELSSTWIWEDLQGIGIFCSVIGDDGTLVSFHHNLYLKSILCLWLNIQLKHENVIFQLNIIKIVKLSNTRLIEKY